MASILFGRKKLYEPTPRFSHGAAAVGGRCYLWGGCVQDFTESGRRKLALTVEIFDPHLGTWEEHHTTGVPPPGLYSGACTSLLDSLHWFGGYDGKYFYNSLHKLDPTTLEWRELQPLNQADGPMKKIGVEWSPSSGTSWLCLVVMAFPLVPFSLEQCLPRVLTTLKGVDGAMSSMCLTS